MHSDRTALVGLQFGDEGKGKYVTYFLTTERVDVDARYNGGGNAGHTIIAPNGKVLATHQVPSGIVFADVYNAMLHGMFIDPAKLKTEIEDLRAKGYDVDPSNLGISGLAHVTLGHHIELERLDEQRRGRGAIGTTFSGIGPTAEEKYGRRGIRFAEFVNPESFRRLLEAKSEELRQRGYPVENLDFHAETYAALQEFLSPFLIDEAELNRRKRNAAWLYEGAQGILLDPDFGSYPYVTSTHAGKAPRATVVGVAKAYITRVGGGPLPTRMDEQTEALIRGERGSAGAEFGATTGRPRSCGWFDIPAARYAVEIGGVDVVALTKLDVLSRVPVIKVCTHYDCDGRLLDTIPADRFELERCKPVYEEVRGWPGVDISGARILGDLPVEARDYLKMLQDALERPIEPVSVGPSAEQTIEM